MACLCVRIVVSRPRPLQARRRPSTVIRAAWTPAWEHQHPDQPPENFRSLFAVPYLPPTNNPLTVYDARDALEACTGLWGDARQECLETFGVDGEMADAFYSTVMHLEMALNQDTDPEEEALHHGQERC